MATARGLTGNAGLVGYKKVFLPPTYRACRCSSGERGGEGRPVEATFPLPSPTSITKGMRTAWAAYSGQQEPHEACKTE